ncbi:sugar ABC transporter permease [Spirochaetia bacterium]|nr:sugar ABC transporter permease [Spirochaetia bacterium]
MILPSVILVLIFNYYPMYGLIISFQNYQPSKGFLGSKFVGMFWFKYLFNMPDFWQVVGNTFSIAIQKIIWGQLIPITFAVMLNEVRAHFFKRTVQTIVYLPYFLSWVVVGSMFVDFLSTTGIVNQFLGVFGITPIFFLGSNTTFQGTIVAVDVWKNFGWTSIIYLAALTGINPELYEVSSIDGANRISQLWHITLPGIRPMIMLMVTLALGNILNAGFEQLLMMYNTAVYQTGDILDTFVYRSGLLDAQFSLSTAVGLMKSISGCILIVLSQFLVSKFSDYRIF